MAMKENTYIIFNQTEIPKIGTGCRKIFVRESKKYAYIRGRGENEKVRMKLPIWLQLKADRFKINDGCAEGTHEGCRCVTSYGSNVYRKIN
jgi:hypothetical protein